MSSKIKNFFFLLGLVCTSCLTPPIAEKQPVLNLKKSWKHESTSNTTILPTKDCWWKVFQDPRLDQLIQKGLKNSPTIKKALARFDEALWYTRTTGADQFPQLSFNTSANRQRIAKNLRTKAIVPTKTIKTPKIPTTPIQTIPGPLPLPPPPPVLIPATPKMKTVRSPKFVNDLIANLSISYEFDFWGKYYLTTQAAKARAEAAQDDLETARLLLVDQIASTYFTLQAIDKGLVFLLNEISLHTKRLSLLSKQVASGLTNEFLLLQEQTLLESKKSDEQAFLKTQENNLSLLAVLIGEPANNANITIASAPWTFPIIPAGLPSSLLAKRPDIRSAIKEIDAVIADIGIAKTELLPSLTLSGIVGQEARKANKWFKWKNNIWSIGASLAQPIFDADRRMSEVKATKARFRQAAATLTDTVLNSIKEVEDALILIKTQRERKNFAINREKDLSTIANLRNELYTKGVQDIIMSLQAQEELLQAKQDRINEEYNLQLGTLALMKSLGGNWE